VLGQFSNCNVVFVRKSVSNEAMVSGDFRCCELVRYTFYQYAKLLPNKNITLSQKSFYSDKTVLGFGRNAQKLPF